MCGVCWVEVYHRASVDNEHVRAAVPLILRVYHHSCVGGNLHVILDDWNLETDNFSPFIRRLIRKEPDPRKREAEEACYNALRWMTVAERASALARHEGHIIKLRGTEAVLAVMDDFIATEPEHHG